MRRYMFAALVGALTMYFFDPERGTARRTQMADRLAGSGRDLGRDLGRAGRKVSSDAEGLRQKFANAEPHETVPNDETLAHKVETELFRDGDVPKGDINVNAQNGVVYIRGQVDRPDLIETIEARVRRIPGVQAVENLLHTRGTPAKRR